MINIRQIKTSKKPNIPKKIQKTDKTKNRVEKAKTSGSKDKNQDSVFHKNLFRVKTRKLPFLQPRFN